MKLKKPKKINFIVFLIIIFILFLVVNFLLKKIELNSNELFVKKLLQKSASNLKTQISFIPLNRISPRFSLKNKTELKSRR